MERPVSFGFPPGKPIFPFKWKALPEKSQAIPLFPISVWVRLVKTTRENLFLFTFVSLFPFKQTNRETNEKIDDPKDFERRSLHIVSRGQKSYVLILEITHCAFCNRICCYWWSSSCCDSFSSGFSPIARIRRVHRRIVCLCKQKRSFISTIYRKFGHNLLSVDWDDAFGRPDLHCNQSCISASMRRNIYSFQAIVFHWSWCQ